MVDSLELLFSFFFRGGGGVRVLVLYVFLNVL